MNPQAINPPSQEPVAMAASPGFTPVCPLCQYDLSGLADGRCPECGTQFELAELRTMTERQISLRKYGPMLDAAAQLICIGAYCMWLLWGAQSHTPRVVTCRPAFSPATYAGFIVSAVACAAYGCALSSGVTRERHHHLLVLVLPLQLVLIGLCLSTPVWFLGVLALFVPLVCATWILSFFADHDQLRARFWLIVMSVSGTLAVVGSVSLCGDLSRDQWWTEWIDPRHGQEHVQYPLNVHELTWVVGIAAVVFVISLPLLIRARERVNCKCRNLMPRTWRIPVPSGQDPEHVRDPKI